MDNPLSKLELDYWYKVLMVVSFVVFLLAAMGLLKAFPTAPTAFISLGVFFIGMSEWINHPLQTGFLPATIYRPGGVVTSHPRRSSFIGNIFLWPGLILVALGLFRLVR